MDIESEPPPQIAAAAVILENSDTHTLACFSSLVFLHAEQSYRGFVAIPAALVELSEKKRLRVGLSAIRPFVGELDYWARSLPGGVPITHSLCLSDVSTSLIHKKMRDQDWRVGVGALVNLETSWRFTFPWLDFFRAEKDSLGARPGEWSEQSVEFFRENLNRKVAELRSKHSEFNVGHAQQSTRRCRI